MRAIRPSTLFGALLVLPVVGLALLACNANQATSVRRTPSVSTSEVLFKAPDAVVALAADGEEKVYALTVGGTLLVVTPDGKSQELAAGLENCSSSFPVLALLPDGSLVINDCVDKKDTLVRIDQAGSKTTLRQFEQNIESLAADGSGTVYLGAWSSVGNLMVSFQPSTYLAAATPMSSTQWPSRRAAGCWPRPQLT